MKRHLPAFLALLCAALVSQPRLATAQTGSVGIGITTPDASAKLDLSSTTQGTLLTRMTAAQRAAIASPAPGLIVYQTDATLGLYYYDGVNWRSVIDGRVVTGTGYSFYYGVVTTFAGSGSTGSTDAAGTAASFNYPTGVAVDAAGNVYVADRSNHKIRKISAAGVVTTLAGSGSIGSFDATGTAASFKYPAAVAVDAAGNVYVADQYNHKIRMITAAGVVTTLAGSGTAGSTDATGTAASFNLPNGVAVDAAGNVYVADQTNNKIRKITSAGVVTTFAGSGGQGSTDGTGTAASFNYPTGVALDVTGNVYVADQGSRKIRMITAAGVVTTLAGSGTAGSTDGAGTAASFYYPTGIAVDAVGNIYVTDQFNHKIRRITATGLVTTLAGSGAASSTDGTGTGASFNGPLSVAADATGNVYVADQGNHKIRRITTR